MPKKKTFEEVRAAFNQRGFMLVSKEYKNSYSSLKYLCSNGHNATISFNDLQSGKGCAECGGTKKKTIEEVRELFTARNYTLLSTEYKNNRSLLLYICDQGHNATIRFADLQNGQGCLECSGKKKKTLEEARELFNSRGYTLLSIEYKNAFSPLEYLCSNGHQTKIRLAELQSGRGCSSCAEHGFNPDKTAILYYLRFQFEGNFYYKIGITNRSISERFKSERTAYTVLKESDYSFGQDARDKEQAILKEFAKFRYKGKPFLDSGNTELFTKDILYIDSSVLVTC